MAYPRKSETLRDLRGNGRIMSRNKQIGKVIFHKFNMTIRISCNSINILNMTFETKWNKKEYSINLTIVNQEKENV